MREATDAGGGSAVACSRKSRSRRQGFLRLPARRGRPIRRLARQEEPTFKAAPGLSPHSSSSPQTTTATRAFFSTLLIFVAQAATRSPRRGFQPYERRASRSRARIGNPARASMTTNAWAKAFSSVRVRWMNGSAPGGTIAFSRSGRRRSAAWSAARAGRFGQPRVPKTAAHGLPSNLTNSLPSATASRT